MEFGSPVLLCDSSDESMVRKVAEAMLANSFQFWWEHSAPDSELTHQSVLGARCVVVFLSRTSCQSDKFVELASLAAQRGTVILALLDRVKVPKQIKAISTVDLSNFAGSENDLALLDLINAARAKYAGVDPAPPRGFLTRRMKHLATLSWGGFATIALLIGFRTDLVAWINEGALLPIATPGEEKSWNEIPFGNRNSCEALKQITGHYLSKARELLDHPRRKAFKDTEITSTSEFQVAVAYGDTYGLTEVKARTAALEMFGKEAATFCDLRSKSTGDEVVSPDYKVQEDEYECVRASDRFTCKIASNAKCKVRTVRVVNVCGELPAVK